MVSTMVNSISLVNNDISEEERSIILTIKFSSILAANSKYKL